MSDTNAADAAVAQFRDDYAPWFLSLDDTVRGYFDAIFRQEPELVYRVFTGQSPPEEARLGGTTLTELLGQGASSSFQLMPLPGIMALAVDPAGPDANTPFVVRWTETNMGAASQGHESQVVVSEFETTQEVFTGPRVAVAALAANAEAQLEQQVPGLPTGEYSIRVWANVDGADSPADASASVGLRSMNELSFGVGGADPSRPKTRAQANMNAIGEALAGIGDAWSDIGQYPRGEAVARGLRGYAGVLDAGQTEGDDLMPRLLAAAGRAQALQVDDPVAWRDAHLTELEGAMATVQQVQSLEITPEAGAEALITFADGLA